MRVAAPEAGLSLWPRIPAGETSSAYALRLLNETAVAIAPGVNFGWNGEGYPRVSLTAPDERIAEAAKDAGG